MKKKSVITSFNLNWQRDTGCRFVYIYSDSSGKQTK